MTERPGGKITDSGEPERLTLDILVVEDSVVIRTALVGLLKEHNVVQARDGREALAITERERFDVVLMDVQMPEMDGFEATAAIRKREQGYRTPIIAMTASAMEEDRHQCLAAGMDDFLPKPIRPEQLRRTIGQITQLHGYSQSDSAPDEEHDSLNRQPSADVMDLELARRQIPGGEEGVRSMAQLLHDQCPILIMELETVECPRF